MGALRAEWGAQLRGPWQDSLRKPGLMRKDVAVHLVALQQFCTSVDTQHVLTRAALMKRVSESRWAAAQRSWVNGGWDCSPR